MVELISYWTEQWRHVDDVLDDDDCFVSYAVRIVQQSAYCTTGHKSRSAAGRTDLSERLIQSPTVRIVWLSYSLSSRTSVAVLNMSV